MNGMTGTNACLVCEEVVFSLVTCVKWLSQFLGEMGRQINSLVSSIQAEDADSLNLSDHETTRVSD